MMDTMGKTSVKNLKGEWSIRFADSIFMADSGAREMPRKIRQLAGMRGFDGQPDDSIIERHWPRLTSVSWM
jgi:DNA-directed RNA polymerase beta' subunit